MSERLVALIPAYNEAACVGEVVRRTRPFVSEVVVVDDGSVDGTAAVAEQAGATVLRHEKNLGKGAAIATALEFFGRSDAVFAVFLDADAQHDPAEIPKFLEAAKASGAAVVVGNRMGETAAMPRLRRWTNRFTSWLTGKLARQKIPDSQCGYRLVGRGVLKDLRLSTAHFEAETEMLIQAGRAGQKIVSVPVRTIYEPGRASRIRPLRDTVRFLKLVARYLW
jgi:glycosyltransferase involved in cell wall biosynthesis